MQLRACYVYELKGVPTASVHVGGGEGNRVYFRKKETCRQIDLAFRDNIIVTVFMIRSLKTIFLYFYYCLLLSVVASNSACSYRYVATLYIRDCKDCKARFLLPKDFTAMENGSISIP